MFQQQLQSFNGLGLGARASAQVPPRDLAVGKIDLNFGGGLTKANLTEIVVKYGTNNVIGPISATDLDKIMKYRGQFDHASFLPVDLTERNLLSPADKDLGAIDLPTLNRQALFVEVVNSLGAGTPTLTGVVGFVKRQSAKDPAERTARQLLMHKLKRYSIPSSANPATWYPIMDCAWIKRLHFFYAGTDWTTTADGNLSSVEIRQNGAIVHDSIGCLKNRVYQQQQGLVPQSRVYTVDFIADGNLDGVLRTKRGNAQDIEVKLNFTAPETCICYAEVLDRPGNL